MWLLLAHCFALVRIVHSLFLERTGYAVHTRLPDRDHGEMHRDGRADGKAVAIDRHRIGQQVVTGSVDHNGV